jgi:hypothetical protein
MFIIINLEKFALGLKIGWAGPAYVEGFRLVYLSFVVIDLPYLVHCSYEKKRCS